MVNLIPGAELSTRYTYNFRGNSQVLDHVLVSNTLAESARPEIEIVHLNADWPALARASDHDPIVVKLEIPNL